MKVTIFGATGLVGKYLVKQAILKDHYVKAFSRNVMTADFPENNNLELVAGSAFDEDEVYNAIKGSDVVLSALGGSIDGVDKTRSLGMKTIVAQMQKAGVKRIVAIGGVGILNEGDSGRMIMESKHFPAEYLAVSNEHLQALEHLKNTQLDWTMVCPPMIAEGDATGEYKVKAETLPASAAGKVYAGDISLFMLNEMTDNNYVKQRVGITN